MQVSRLEQAHNVLIDCILDKEGIDTHHTVEDLEKAKDYLRELLDRLDQELYCLGCCDGLESTWLREILE